MQMLRRSSRGRISSPNSKENESANYSLDLSLSTNSKSDGRRLTADQADIQSLLNGLDDDMVSSKGSESKRQSRLTRKSVGLNSSHISSITNDNSKEFMSPYTIKSPNDHRVTANSSDIAAIIRDFELDESMSETKSKKELSLLHKRSPKKRTDQQRNNSRRNTVDPIDIANMLNGSCLSDEVNSNRRLTADPESMAAILRSLDDDDSQSITSGGSIINQKAVKSRKSSSIKSNRNNMLELSEDSTSRRRSKRLSTNRRVTADPADMEALLQGIDQSDDDIMTKTSKRTSFGAFDELEPRTGRESIDTIQLMKSLNNLIHETSDEQIRDEVSDLIDLDDSKGYNADEANNSADSINTVDLMSNIKGTLGDGYIPASSLNESSNLLSFSEGSILRVDNTNSPDQVKITNPASTMPSSAIKGILSCRKEHNPTKNSSILNSARKTVNFGSPAAAEFHKTSPTTSFTPLNKQQAKHFFPQHFSSDSNNSMDRNDKEDEDDLTAANTEILDQWDKLSNTCGNVSDEDILTYDNEGNIVLEESKSDNLIKKRKNRKSIDSNASKRSHRRKSMIIKPSLLLMDNVDDNNANEGENAINVNDISAIVSAENSFTVALPGNLMDLMSEAENVLGDDDMPVKRLTYQCDDDSMNDDDGTQELEGNLQSMIRHIDYNHHSIAYDSDLSVTSHGEEPDKSEQLSISLRSSSSNQSSLKSLGPLIGLSTSDHDAMVRESESHNDSKYNSSSKQFKGSLTNDHVDDSVTVDLEEHLGDIVKKNEQNSMLARGFSLQLNGKECDDYTQTLESNMMMLVNQLAPIEESYVEKSESNISDHRSKRSTDTPFSWVSNHVSPESLRQIESLEMEDNAVKDSVEISESLSDPIVSNGPLIDEFSGKDSKDNEEGQRVSTRDSFMTSDLKQRLKMLNENARMNSLKQSIKTPLQSQRNKSREMIYFSQQKSMSKLNSTMPLIATNTIVMESQVAVTADYQPVLLSMLFQRGDISSVDDLISIPSNTYTLMKILTDNINHQHHQSNDSSNDNDMTIKNIFIDLFEAAIKEMMKQLNTSLSFSSYETLWNESNHHQTTPETFDSVIYTLPKIKDQVKKQANYIWSLWETKLCEIAYETIKMKSKQLHEQLNQLKLSNDQLEKSYESSMISQSMNQQVNDKDNHKLVLIQQLSDIENDYYNLQRMIELTNRYTYCQIKTISSNQIIVNGIFSSTYHILLDFRINSLSNYIENIHIDIITSNMDLNNNNQDHLLMNAYFADILCNNIYSGPLSSSMLDKIQKVSQIPSLIHKVSGSIAMYKLLTRWLRQNSLNSKWIVQGNSVIYNEKETNQSITLSIRQILCNLFQ